MADQLRFDGRVVIVTGAGNGLGRAHALLFGSRGAKVVVNDLGGGRHGDGASSAAADKVVDEIKALGGEAVANYDSVTDGEKIVKTALDAFGKIDIVINNAGILRDQSFHKMTQADWDLIYQVHVLGSYKVTHAAWDLMREQGYGRVIFTASAAGIYGNRGQANYSMAKLGLHGLSQTLAIEGQRRGIHVNTIAPIAGSRLTETVLPKDLVDALDPAVVSPLVAYLCHEGCAETGGLFEVGGGTFSKLRWQKTKGVTYRVGRKVTPEDVKAQFGAITDFSKATFPATILDSMAPVTENLSAGPSKGGNEWVDVDQALGFKYPKAETRYDERDLAIYALGVGDARDPMNESSLRHVYEMHGKGFQALPSYGVIPALTVVMNFGRDGVNAPGLNYGIDRILHGEQYLELKRPLPSKAKLTHEARIKDIWDKTKGALIVTEVITRDEDGDELFRNEITSFARGCGGWGGERGPDANVNVPPSRKPDAVVEQQTDPNQALLYRLSGDWNPLHADPSFAKAMRFDKPILHGLCTFGFAVRHVLEKMAPEGNFDFFKSVKVRFADTVFPGETLVTEMWKEGDRKIVFQTKVKERDSVCISNAAIELFDAIPKKAPKPKAAAKAAGGAAATATVTVADIMNAIGNYVGETPSLGPQIGKIFGFKISNPDSSWVLNVKDNLGVTQGDGGSDVLFELSAENFMKMVSGEVSPQKLYFGGDLKIKGDVMASQKLTFLDKVTEDRVKAEVQKRVGSGGGEAAAEAGAGGGAASGAPKTADLMRAMGLYVERNKDAVSKIGKSYCFRIGNEAYLLDLKERFTVVPGAEGPADCTFTMSEENYQKMVTGQATPQKLYFGGDLKIEGDVMASQKLTFLDKVDESLVREAMGARPAAAAPAAAAAAPAASKKDAVAPKVITALTEKVGKKKDLLKGLKAPVQFVVKEPAAAFVVDPKEGVKPGERRDVATVLTLDDAALAELVKNPGSAASLYQHGKLRVDGDLSAARSLGFLEGLV